MNNVTTVKTGRLRYLFLGCLCAVMAPASARTAAAEDPEQVYAPPRAEDVQTRALEWAAARTGRDKELRKQVARLWAVEGESLSARERFEKVIETFRLVDPEARALIDACRLVEAPLVPPTLHVLEDGSASGFFRANLALFYGRYLVRRKMYDQAHPVLARIDPAEVVDPASCLFFKAVCEHQLLMKNEGLATIKQLRENTEDVPPRYANIAELMQYELEKLRDKSLDKVARLMKDVERRLDLGRGGKDVQKQEKRVIAELDDLIEKLEQQQQQQSSSSAGGSGRGRSNQPSSPAEDSSVMGSKAPGNVDEKDLGKESGWGALPPKAASRAKNLLNRNFPAHYRRAVEQYFKKLAGQRKSSGGTP